MKRLDVIIIAVGLLLGAVWLLLPRGTGAFVCVQTQQGRNLYPLFEDAEIVLPGNLVVISGGEVRMESADCPGGDCLAHAPIRRAGESIVCLPNRVVVTVEGGKSDGPDAVTGGAA